MDVEIVGRALTTLAPDDEHPYRTGPWRPQSVEWRAGNLEVVGERPRDPDGIYLRNTENPVHPAIGRYHPFEGDGMIHAVGFRDGEVFYRNRFVRTDAFNAEQEAGESLWVGLAERPSKAKRADGWGARGHLKDASSTDVVVHNGLVLSSFYECGDLYQLDPFTLDDRGKATWKGQFPSDRGVSAHPKVDEHTGEMLFFNYSRKDPYLHYGVIDAEDNLVHYVGIDLPGPSPPASVCCRAGGSRGRSVGSSSTPPTCCIGPTPTRSAMRSWSRASSSTAPNPGCPKMPATTNACRASSPWTACRQSCTVGG